VGLRSLVASEPGCELEMVVTGPHPFGKGRGAGGQVSAFLSGRGLWKGGEGMVVV
jgi:hypothetical protein